MNKKPEVNLQRQKIYKKEELLDWPSGNPDQIIEQMQALKVKYSQWVDFTVDYEWTGYEDCEYFVTGYILEADEAYEERIQEEKEALQLWEIEEVDRLETNRIKQADKKKAKIEEQLRQYNLLREKLEKEGVLK